MDIGKCFREATEIYQRNLLVLVATAVIYDLLSIVSLLILLGPLTGGICLQSLRAVRSKDQQVLLGDLFGGFSKFFTLLGLLLLTIIPLTVATLFFIVPGLLLGTIWMFDMFLVVDRSEGIFSSLKNSCQMVMHAGFGNCIVLFLIVSCIGFAPAAIPYVGIIVGWFVAPLSWLVMASAYNQIIESQKLPLSTEEQRDAEQAGEYFG